MCEAKPGARCQNGAAREHARARAALDDALTKNPTDKAQIERRLDAVFITQCNVDASTGGMAALDQQIASKGDPDGNLTRRRSAAVLLRQARDEQVAAMPPAQTKHEATQARSIIGQARERLAYLTVLSTEHPTNPRYATEMAHAQSEITQWSAQWRLPGPDGTYPVHCSDCGQFTHTDHNCPGIHQPTSREDATVQPDDSPLGRYAAGALYSSEEWQRRLDASSPLHPVNQERRLLAEAYMMAHGQLRCPACRGWKSAHFNDHQCPADHDIDDYTEPDLGPTAPCPACQDHPGWATAEAGLGLRASAENVCRRCLGSGGAW